MGAMMLLWVVAPAAAFAVFIGLSAFHFGEVRGHGRSLALTHGLFVIGVAASARPDTTHTLLAAMNIPVVSWLPPTWIWLTLHAGTIAYFAGSRGLTPALQTEVLDSFFLFLMLTTLHPVIGFVLYFTLWHAMDHLEDLKASWARRCEGARSRRHDGGRTDRR